MKLIRFTHIFLPLILLGIFQSSYGQNGVAIAATTATADNSAMLDVQSTTKGALIPRMTNAQRSSISSPANGLLVFCTDAPIGLYYYNTAIPAWVILSAGALTGSGTTNYDVIWTGSGTLGTGIIYNNGSNAGVGTTAPNYKLDVAGSIGIANNNNSSTNKLYLASGDANHYIYSTGTGGNSMFFCEYGGVFNFYNTSTSTTQVSLNAGALSATGAINSGVGYTVAGAAASGSYLRGNGTDFVSSTIQAADLSAGISGTTNYMAKFTGTNTVGSSSVLYETGGEIGVNNTTPATGAAISFLTSGGGTTNNIAWGTGPYTSIYDNANVHYYTDDYTNYESGATGTGATFNWSVGATKNAGASPNGTTWMNLNNGLLSINSINSTNAPIPPSAGYAAGSLAVTSNDGPLYTNSSGTIVKATSCPSGYQWYSNGITVICAFHQTTAATGNNAEIACENASGGHMCYYHEVEYACNQGMSLYCTDFLADRVGDDTYMYVNTCAAASASTCGNFDGCCGNRTNSWGYYCCIDFVRF